MPVKTSRFAVFIIITSVFVILILWKYVDIMLISPAPSANVSGPDQIVERGPILDRNGRILAIQTQMDSVTAWMPNVTEKEETAELLSKALNLEYSGILDKFSSYTGFLYIKRKISPTESKRIKELFNEDKLAGISLEPEYGRNYPERNLTSHLTGFTGTDNTGLDGLELTYNDILAPDIDSDDPVIYGNQLFLTIDLNIQYFSRKLAEKAFNDYNAESVIILVMDADNGDLLGWVSMPDYDPNAFNTATERQKNNLPVTYAYEPGSVFKVFSLASELEIGGITTDSHFYCDGHYEHEYAQGETVTINCLGVHGDVTVADIIKYSCNSGAAYASDTVSREDFYSKINSFGFNSRTNLPFPGETPGILGKTENWSIRTKPTIAMGQEISVSAVQMVTAATVLANHGTLLQPHIIDKIVSPEGKLIRDFKREPVRHVVKPAVADSILEMMEAATEYGGTASRAAIDGIRISAKTGTAQKINPETGKYSKTSFVASTLAILPTEDPELILYTVIDTPQGDEFFGGRIVTPIIRDLAQELIRYLHIKTDADTEIQHSGIIKVEDVQKLKPGSTLPDLTGLSKRDLLPLIALPGVNVQMKGEGWVINQSPEPGTPISEGMTVELEFE